MKRLPLLCVAGALALAVGCDDDRDGTDAAVPMGDGSVPGVDGGPTGPTPGEWTSCEQPAPMACAEPLGDGSPLRIEGSTAEATDDFGGASCGRGGDGAPDAAFQWTAPSAGEWTFSTEGTDEFDTLLYVRRGGCDATDEMACNDDVGDGIYHSRVTVSLEACETVTVVVDGYSMTQRGPFVLNVSGVETVCDDGLDGDGDGAIDCDDLDCFSAACPTGDGWPREWRDLEWEVLELTNQERARGASCGGEAFGPAGPLEMDEVIQVAARLHSQDMGEQNYFMHDSLDGRTFSDRMTEAGFSGAPPWGENIAAGQATAAEVVQGWMESPGHCRNIMNPDFHVIGIGYANVGGSDYGHYWTQDFAGSH
ncbi:MAG TPA: CAP domain-containing protein [Sandaracinaceae bacterium LLY-WYZ-13_1]|nr:CAP domain-containing protein [Sandaracinaceae bacterium LLY-WYZ-13_1]